MLDLTDAQQIADQQAVAAAEGIDVGVVVGLPSGTAETSSGPTRVLVNVYGSREDLPVASHVLGRLRVNDSVIVLRGQPGSYVVGKMHAGQNTPVPGTATVTGWGTPNQTVMVKDTQNRPLGPYSYLASYAPNAGDLVALVETPAGPIVMGRIATAAGGGTGGDAGGVQPPPSGHEYGTTTFPAVDARSWRNGAWRTDSGVVAQGDWGGFGANSGFWFYGNGPTDTLRGAAIEKTEVRIRRRSGGVWGPQTAHLSRHADRTRPAGRPNGVAGPVNADIDIGQTLWVDLPAAWGQTIVDAGGGLMIDGAPYVVLDGLDSDGESGLLRLTWSRTR